jgi:hypothetical protein
MRRFLIDNLLPDPAAAAPSVSTMSAEGKEIRRSRSQRSMPRWLIEVNNIN